MPKSQRMIANSKEKAEFRRVILKETISRCNQAIKAGYYLEAITLMESLIADRLESRALYLNKKNASFQTLFNLCGLLNDDEFLSYIIPDIREWSQRRNAALHTLAKIDDNNMVSFDQKYSVTKETARQGMQIFRRIDRALKQSRRVMKK